MITGTSRDDVQAFLSLVYLGEVNIAPSSLASVESLADRFQIALVKQCSAVISVLNKTQKFLCNCGQKFSNRKKLRKHKKLCQEIEVNDGIVIYISVYIQCCLTYTLKFCILF